jgi:hypothetical protein
VAFAGGLASRNPSSTHPRHDPRRSGLPGDAIRGIGKGLEASQAGADRSMAAHEKTPVNAGAFRVASRVVATVIQAGDEGFEPSLTDPEK